MADLADLNLKSSFGQDLRESYECEENVHEAIRRLKKTISETSGEEKVKALGIVVKESLPTNYRISNNLRLAHVYQWQERFEKADQFFTSTLEEIKRRGDLNVYLAFAYQHSAKSFFDQQRYVEALGYFEKALEIRIEEAAPEDQIESTKHSLKITRDIVEAKR